MMSLRIKSQRGDTIVEVLIAIAVASSVLAVTYVTMNRNLTITRVSQERTEASKVAQGQIEALKARMDSGNTVSYPSFCIDITNNLSIILLPSGTPAASLAAETDFSTYPAGCRSNNIYNFAIEEIDSRTFRFYVRWDRIGGGGKEEVIMVYKI
jgi:type II secretory pathway pseudopilin PulG